VIDVHLSSEQEIEMLRRPALLLLSALTLAGLLAYQAGERLQQLVFDNDIPVGL
jgi:hypothetical protein